MQSIILILHILIAVSIIALVLLQHGKGADAGAAFGSGSSNTMFGSSGSTPFLMKVTVILAVGFFATSISLSYLVSRQQKQQAFVTMPGSSSPAQTTTSTAPKNP